MKEQNVRLKCPICEGFMTIVDHGFKYSVYCNVWHCPNCEGVVICPVRVLGDKT